MDKLTVAHFSMDVVVDPAIPAYNGGLGILAGDTLRAAADLSVPMIGMTLCIVRAISDSILMNGATRPRSRLTGHRIAIAKLVAAQTAIQAKSDGSQAEIPSAETN